MYEALSFQAVSNAPLTLSPDYVLVDGLGLRLDDGGHAGDHYGAVGEESLGLSLARRHGFRHPAHHSKGKHSFFFLFCWDVARDPEKGSVFRLSLCRRADCRPCLFLLP